MSLMDSKGSLTKASKELMARWEEVKNVWSDAQSREFERIYLEPLQQDMRSAVGAMEQMNQVLQGIEHDCR